MHDALNDPESADTDEPYKQQAIHIAERFAEALLSKGYSEIWHELVAADTKEVLAAKAHLQSVPDFADAFGVSREVVTQEFLSFVIANDVMGARAGFLEGLRNSLERAGWLPVDSSRAEVRFLNEGAIVVMPDEVSQFVVPLLLTSVGYRIDLETFMVASQSLQIHEFIDSARHASDEGDFPRAVRLLENANRLQRSHNFLRQYAWKSLFTSQRWKELQQDAASLALLQALLEENRELASVDIAEAIRRGEDDTTEFISEMPSKGNNDSRRGVAKELAAFSTTRGGRIFFGITDAKEVLGIPEVDKPGGQDDFRQRIDTMCKDNIKPSIIVRMRFVPHRASNGTVTVPVVVVPRGQEPVYYVEHRPYLRSGQSSRPADPHEVFNLHCNYFIRQGWQPPVKEDSPPT